MDRRQFVIGSAAAAATLTREAAAQEAFPTRPVTIINAFPPGGINDLVTRPAASVLETVFKQPVVVDTKAGAAGAVGAQVAANAKPDGYTILSHNNGISGYAEVDRLFGRQPKTTRADFIPLGRLCADPVLVLVNDQQPWKTLAEFVEDAKKRPQEIVYSSGGLYGASHLPGVVQLAECAIVERHREGFHRAIEFPCHQCCDGAAVDTAREEHAERNICHQPQADGLLQQRSETLDEIALRGIRQLGIGTVLRDVPVLPDPDAPTLEHELVTRQEFIDALEQRVCASGIARCQHFG